MTPERWQQIDELFHAALAHEPTERAAFLGTACSGDESLRIEVESLLAYHEENQNFIETPAGDVAAAMLGAHQARFESGHLIANYKIVRQLGSGGMGEIYLAIDTRLGRKVALKLLPEIFTTDVARIHRFKIEARAASALNHPNILTVHEINEDAVRFIVTEFVDGQTLRESLIAGPLKTNEALRIAEQIASALAAAQAEGIIHRDIKPENIMLRRDGIVKVLDFGLAKLTHDRFRKPDSASSLLETSGAILMGTTHYMSPEQARGLKVDGRTDIFSLGAVLYEMITGEKAFKGETSSDVIASVLTTDPSFTSILTSGVPELERVVSKALEKDRERRYATVDDMLLDLRKLRQQRELNLEVERARSSDLIWSASDVPVASTVPKEISPITAELTRSQRTVNDLILGPITRHKVSSAVIATVFAAVVIATAFLASNHPPPLTDKDFILIADFVNTTGDPVFDGTLKQALSVQLAQSPFLNIFPEDRIRETLAYMEKPADERLTRDIAREICHRQGLKAVLVGSIASLGNNYVITLEAVAQSDDLIVLEQIEAESKEKVLASLGVVASRLRKKLGESLSSIQRFDVPIEQATTSSLEALKAFAKGNNERSQGRERAALGFYQRAVEIDPNFALAYARIGVAYLNQGEEELARQFFKKAFELRDRISERERFYISEKYHAYLTGDILQAVQELETWRNLYPHDYIAHSNLALQYLVLARYEDAVKEAQEALRLGPTYPTPRLNLVAAYLALGRYAEAEQISNEMAALNPDSINTHFERYIFAFLRGDRPTMAAEIAGSRGKNEESFMLSLAAQTSFYYGQLETGGEETRRSVALHRSQNQKENAAQTQLTLASAQMLFGKCSDAQRTVKPALEISRSKSSLLSAAVVLTECNKLTAAQALLDESLNRFPHDTLVVLMSAPVIRALIEKHRGNQSEAIKQMEMVRAYDFGIVVGSINNFTRGQIYLDLNKGSEAAIEFQTIIDKRGPDLNSPRQSLAYLGLARAAALAGDIVRSRKAYQDFFALWKDADRDLPVLIQAQREYERLNR